MNPLADGFLPHGQRRLCDAVRFAVQRVGSID
jgi:hypothetical protein